MGNLLPGGWNELRKHNHALAVKARQRLCQRLCVEPPCPEELLGSMATIPLPWRLQNVPRSGKIDAEQLRLYDQFNIEVPFNRFGQPEKRWFRISAQAYNSLPEYEYLAQALQTL